MPKRKSEISLNYIAKKLKYLEKEVKRNRRRSRRRSVSSSSEKSSKSRSSSSESSTEGEKDTNYDYDLPDYTNQQHSLPMITSQADNLQEVSSGEPQPSTSQAAIMLEPQASTSQGAIEAEPRATTSMAVLEPQLQATREEDNLAAADRQVEEFKLEDDERNTQAGTRSVDFTSPADDACSTSSGEHLPSPLRVPAASAAAAAAAPARSLIEQVVSSAATDPQALNTDERKEHSNDNYPGCRGIIRTAMLKKGVPSTAIDILIASLSDNTIKQYNVCMKKWFYYSINNNINLYQPSIGSILSFLTEVYETGQQYCTINNYRSAMSLILGSIMHNDLISRFCKGVYRLRPTLPKYNVTWDVNVVLDYLASLVPHDQITLEQLTKKCCTLIALVTAHRVQTISKINVKNIIFNEQNISIKITDIIKTSRPGSAQPILHLPFYNEKPQICPAKTLISYLEITRNIRRCDNLFISFRKPHNSVTSQTISRWLKCIMEDSGVDVTIFTGHSMRHASTSMALKRGVNVDLIRNTAGWSGNSTIFARYYNREIINGDLSEFAKSILHAKD